MFGKESISVDRGVVYIGSRVLVSHEVWVLTVHEKWGWYRKLLEWCELWFTSVWNGNDGVQA